MAGRPAPRVALVLGAGGSVGHAYHVGVLSALSDEFGWDAREAELVVGTSAGSVAGATLRAGLHPADMRSRALGQPLSAAGEELVRVADEAVAVATISEELDDDADADADALADPDRDEDEVEVAAAEGWTGRLPRLPRIQIASRERVRRALREPWKVTPGSLFSAMLPPGRRSTEHLRAPYDAILGDAWPAGPLWIVAVELDTGHRVVFGPQDVPRASVGQAVQASCAIPAYFVPAEIDGVRYVDGGVHSTTNADLVTRVDPPPDLVIVSAPMAVVSGTTWRGQRFSMRQLASRWLAGEVARLRADGVEVVTFKPTADDLEVIGGDTMDPAKTPKVCRRAVESTLAHVRSPDIADRLAVLSAG